METILITAQKGGVGKTLIADELMYSLDRTHTPASFLILDAQQSARHAPVDLGDEAVAAVVDMPGYLQEGMPDYLAAADVIVIPCRASMSDQQPLELIRSMAAKYAPDKPVLIVQNQWTRYRLNRMFTDWLAESLRPTEKLLTLRQSEQYALAHMNNESIVTFAPDTGAAEDMRQLLNAIRKSAGLPQEGEAA